MNSPCPTETPPEAIHIRDIIGHQDETVAERVQVLSGRLLQNPLYRLMMVVVVISDCVVVAMQITPDLAKDHGFALAVVETVIHAILIGEISIKWCYSFDLFWLSGSNAVDFLVTLTVILGPTLFPHGGVSLLIVMRVLRVCRSMGRIVSLHYLAPTVKMIAHAVPGVGGVLLFLVLILGLFSVWGVNMFPKSKHFSNLGSALYTLFICLTQDGWVVIFQEFRTSEHLIERYGGPLFFVLFISVGGFILASLFAIITSNFSDDIPEEEILNEPRDQDGRPEPSANEEILIEPRDQDGRPEPSALSTLNDTLREFDRNLKEYDLLYEELKGIVKEMHPPPSSFRGEEGIHHHHHQQQQQQQAMMASLHQASQPHPGMMSPQQHPQSHGSAEPHDDAGQGALMSPQGPMMGPPHRAMSLDGPLGPGGIPNVPF